MATLYSFLFEDALSDLIKKYPQEQERLTKAKELLGMKLTPKYLPWLAKIFLKSQEPVEDMIPVLMSFEKRKSRSRQSSARKQQTFRNTAALKRFRERLRI